MDNVQRYSNNEVNSLNQAELETRALIKAASALNAIKENWNNRVGELDDALERNRKLWTIIVSAMQEDSCPQPKEVRANIINLGLFIFKRTMDIMIEPKPESLNVLIDINMNIAKGLAAHETPEESAS
ncbi:MAG: flagellar biosynthesis regulator FlaF [Alphaproteobacteria bacterium]|nr:flagellar biosynthesis regulator FlaF [Alphaproteobacteria bacterium]